MNQIPKKKQNRFGHWILVFGIYLGFGIWNLEFEISHFGKTHIISSAPD